MLLGLLASGLRALFQSREEKIVEEETKRLNGLLIELNPELLEDNFY